MVLKKKIWLFWFIAPCMLIYTVIFAIPLITVLVTSFCNYTAYQSPVFAGLLNYRNLFANNGNFYDALKNTITWVLLQTAVNVSLGLLVALLLYRKPFGWKFIRASYMIPNIIPSAATGVIFWLIYNPDMGIIKTIYKTCGMANEIPNLLGNNSYSFFAVTCIWLFYAAVSTILIMAEIGTISDSVFEAAKVDGANNWQVDLWITIPMLRNVLATCVILAAVNMMSQFDIIYMTTKGGPGASTLNLPLLLFKTANIDMNYGMANAIGIIQIFMGLGLVFFIGRIFKTGQTSD